MINPAPEIHVLDHKVRLLQAKDGFRTSLDSVFLAAACKAQANETILDMGTGVGGAAFCLLWRVADCRITGVDIQQSHVNLALANIALNNADGRADFTCSDIRTYKGPARFNHVICNPPYLDAGSYTPSPATDRATALGHMDDAMDVKDWIDAGFHNLKSGGTLTMIHRADYVDKIIRGLGKRFGAVEIIPLYPKVGQEAKRVIVRAIKDRKTPARLRAGIILHEGDGAYTKAADEILRDGAAIE